MTITIKKDSTLKQIKEQLTGAYLWLQSNYINNNGDLVLEFDRIGTVDPKLTKEVFDFINEGITSERLINTNKNTTNLIELLKYV